MVVTITVFNETCVYFIINRYTVLILQTLLINHKHKVGNTLKNDHNN